MTPKHSICQLMTRIFRPKAAALLFGAALVMSAGAARAQVQAIPFFDDSTVQTINLTMDPIDWATLQEYYQLDAYYPATFTWNGITESIGVRSAGHGTRSPIKPNLDLSFAEYYSGQTFLGESKLRLKANNADPSNLREWLSMKLFRKMGIPAPREAPAQVFLNGQILGFYYIIEHIDTTFLQRNYGESGGYLYAYQSINDYDFENLGTDPSLYSQFLDLKTSQTAPDLQTFVNLVQVINQPAGATFTDDAFIAALSQYIDPMQFLLYGATEQTLCGADGLIGGQQGMNNFDLYEFQGTTQYNVIPWDKESTLNDVQRDIMDGMTNGLYVNLLAQRLVAIPQYAQVYMADMVNAATLMGSTGGWADSEITREYNVIQAAATDDPNKQCANASGVMASCPIADFETGVADIHSFFTARSAFVLAEAIADGYQPSTNGPQITAGGVASYGGAAALSPGGLATVSGSNLAATSGVGSGSPLPRVVGNTFVAIDGVRAPLLTTASGSILFQVPGDIPGGTAGPGNVVVSANGYTSNTASMSVLVSTPSILAVVHQDGSAVTAASPVIAGEVLSIYATGLGAVNGSVPIGYAGPDDGSATTMTLPQLLVGNVPLTTLYSGLAPGFVGLYQVNALVPTNLGTTSATLSLTEAGSIVPWTAQ
jgi:uncharacterized protein (TIGR03437 family)